MAVKSSVEQRRANDISRESSRSLARQRAMPTVDEDCGKSDVDKNDDDVLETQTEMQERVDNEAPAGGNVTAIDEINPETVAKNDDKSVKVDELTSKMEEVQSLVESLKAQLSAAKAVEAPKKQAPACCVVM